MGQQDASGYPVRSSVQDGAVHPAVTMRLHIFLLGSTARMCGYTRLFTKLVVTWIRYWSLRSFLLPILPVIGSPILIFPVFPVTIRHPEP